MEDGEVDEDGRDLADISLMKCLID